MDVSFFVVVEALRDRCPLRRSSGTGPKMGSRGYRNYGGGIRVSAPVLMFPGYMSIYRRKRSVKRATGGPRGGGRASLPRGLLVDCLASTPSPLDHIVPEITFPEVSYRLDSV